MIRLVPDPRKDVKVLSEEPDGVWAYRFTGFDGRPVIMAWHTGEGEVERQFDVGGGAAMVDMLGKASSPTVSDRKVKVTLSEAPVYILPFGADAARDVAPALKD